MQASMRPHIKPHNPRFSSGPCAKRPGWTPDTLKNALLGRSHRSKPGKEKLALAIEKHLPEKKLICISPYTPTPGYIRIFPNIIHIWKNQNKESKITLINFDQEVKKAGDLTDAIKQN